MIFFDNLFPNDDLIKLNFLFYKSLEEKFLGADKVDNDVSHETIIADNDEDDECLNFLFMIESEDYYKWNDEEPKNGAKDGSKFSNDDLFSIHDYFFKRLANKSQNILKAYLTLVKKYKNIGGRQDLLKTFNLLLSSNHKPYIANSMNQINKLSNDIDKKSLEAVLVFGELTFKIPFEFALVETIIQLLELISPTDFSALVMEYKKILISLNELKNELNTNFDVDVLIEMLTNQNFDEISQVADKSLLNTIKEKILISFARNQIVVDKIDADDEEQKTIEKNIEAIKNLNLSQDEIVGFLSQNGVFLTQSLTPINTEFDKSKLNEQIFSKSYLDPKVKVGKLFADLSNFAGESQTHVNNVIDEIVTKSKFDLEKIKSGTELLRWIKRIQDELLTNRNNSSSKKNTLVKVKLVACGEISIGVGLLKDTVVTNLINKFKSRSSSENIFQHFYNTTISTRDKNILKFFFTKSSTILGVLAELSMCYQFISNNFDILTITPDGTQLLEKLNAKLTSAIRNFKIDQFAEFTDFSTEDKKWILDYLIKATTYINFGPAINKKVKESLFKLLESYYNIDIFKTDEITQSILKIITSMIYKSHEINITSKILESNFDQFNKVGSPVPPEILLTRLQNFLSLDGVIVNDSRSLLLKNFLSANSSVNLFNNLSTNAFFFVHLLFLITHQPEVHFSNHSPQVTDQGLRLFYHFVNNMETCKSLFPVEHPTKLILYISSPPGRLGGRGVQNSSKNDNTAAAQNNKSTPATTRKSSNTPTSTPKSTSGPTKPPPTNPKPTTNIKPTGSTKTNDLNKKNNDKPKEPPTNPNASRTPSLNKSLNKSRDSMPPAFSLYHLVASKVGSTRLLTKFQWKNDFPLLSQIFSSSAHFIFGQFPISLKNSTPTWNKLKIEIQTAQINASLDDVNEKMNLMASGNAVNYCEVNHFDPFVEKYMSSIYPGESTKNNSNLWTINTTIRDSRNDENVSRKFLGNKSTIIVNFGCGNDDAEYIPYFKKRKLL